MNIGELNDFIEAEIYGMRRYVVCVGWMELNDLLERRGGLSAKLV